MARDIRAGSIGSYPGRTDCINSLVYLLTSRELTTELKLGNLTGLKQDTTALEIQPGQVQYIQIPTMLSMSMASSSLRQRMMPTAESSGNTMEPRPYLFGF